MLQVYTGLQRGGQRFLWDGTNNISYDTDLPETHAIGILADSTSGFYIHSFFLCLKADQQLGAAPPLHDLKEVLLEKYLDICSIRNGRRLKGIVTKYFTLYAFEMYCDSLLESTNFQIPLKYSEEYQTVEQFLKICCQRGIMERVLNPCEIVRIQWLPSLRKRKSFVTDTDLRALSILFIVVAFDIRDTTKWLEKFWRQLDSI